jgi:asparagine synthase (glutamine-hydrolysing)
VAVVPVGVFLSGGIDSSTVAAFAAEARDGPIDSFSIGFGRADYDESALAREVARHLGTRHHESHIDQVPFEPSLLELIVDHVGQPLGDASCVPTWVVSRLAREHVGVALSGDGGDELFGGYDHVRWAARVRRVAERAPAALRRAAHGVLAGVAPGLDAAATHLGAARREAWLAPMRRARKGLELGFHGPVEQFRRMRGLWSPEELADLLVPDAQRPLRAELEEIDAAWLELEPEELALALLTRTTLPGAILTKVDRMSMAVGLEVRVPLLDRRVVELAGRLPLELKMGAGIGKRILRRVGRDRLPAAVFSHKKQGFSMPLSDWLGADFWDLFESLYAPGSRVAALFRPAALDAVLANGRRAGARSAHSSEAHDATRAWVLAMLACWMERFEVQV